MLIFLDFDGVLHPVGLPQEWMKDLAYLRASGILFRHLPALTEVLASYSDIQIVVEAV